LLGITYEEINVILAVVALIPVLGAVLTIAVLMIGSRSSATI
jgi:hypothetical protein